MQQVTPTPGSGTVHTTPAAEPVQATPSGATVPVTHAEAHAATKEVVIVAHSTLYYWWPAWAFGFLFALLNAGEERFLARPDNPNGGSAYGLTYVLILLLLIIFTNVRLRGIRSVMLLLALAFVSVTLAWLGWWDDIVRFIPRLSVRMNTGFYTVFSTALLVVWLVMFFFFDRLTYWRIRPGQLTVEHVIGGGAESFDTNSLRFQKLSSDLFRSVLGLGAGDLQATGAGQVGTIYMHNVVFAEKKVRAIEKLISVKPDLPN